MVAQCQYVLHTNLTEVKFEALLDVEVGISSVSDSLHS